MAELQKPGRPEAARRVMLVEDDTLVLMGLRSQIESLGHSIIAEASNASDAMVLYKSRTPDAVLIDIHLGRDDGIMVAAELLKIRRCPMVILSAYSDKSLIDRAADAGVFGYLIKPANADQLRAQLQVAISRFNEVEELIKRNDALMQDLETRKLVEKAKGIFMKRLNLNEPEAHRRLQQESQRRRLGIADLSRKIIESEDLLSDSGKS